MLFPQSYRIKGTVVDYSGTPLELATVFVYEKEGNTMVSGTSTAASGTFEIDLPSSVEYILMASYLEQVSDSIPFFLNENLYFGRIALNTNNELVEVDVYGKKAVFERKADRFVFTVANTSLVQGNIAEVLSRTPGLLVINDQLHYKGETGIRIMINDRLINLPEQNVWDMLSNASAGTVQSIEVITNPPAKYSAEGGVLINIQMAGNLIAGYNGSVNFNFRQGIFPKYNLGMDHSFKTKKSSLTFSYGYSDRKEAKRFVDDTNFFNGTFTSNWNADQRRTLNTIAHTANIFFDWEWGKNTAVSITTMNQMTPQNDQDIHTDTQITGNLDEEFTSFFSTNVLRQNNLTSSTYLDIDHTFPNTKNRLSTTWHFTYFEKERQQEILNDFFDADGNRVDEIDFDTSSDQQIRILTAQMDYDSKLGKKGNFSTGIKFAGIDSNSALLQNGTEVLSNTINATDGAFDYDEQIYAAYGNFDFSWEKTDLAFGLRTEYTESQGLLLSTNEVSENHYLEWFPNFSIKHDLEKDRSIVLYYYRRITRPRYEQINPFQLFQSYNSTVEGNPGLLPATRHYLAGGYNFNKWIGFEIFYRYRRNQLRTLTFQDNSENIIRFINSNVDRELGYGLDLIVNKRITKFWQSYLLASYYYLDNRFQDLESGGFANTSGWLFELTNNNSLDLLANRSLTMDVDISYRSTIAYGNTTAEPYGSVNLSLRKGFWDGKGSLAMGMTDIFSQRAFSERRRFLDQDNSSFLDPETPIASISFRYRFGNTTIKSNKRRRRQGEVDRI